MKAIIWWPLENIVQSLKSCQTLCDPMDCSTPGSPVLHHLPEFAQTHVQWVGDANRLTHPLPRPSPSALNLSQKTLHWAKEARHRSLHVAWMHLCHMYRRDTTTDRWLPGLTGWEGSARWWRAQVRRGVSFWRWWLHSDDGCTTLWMY